jgi:hypothetical protein
LLISIDPGKTTIAAAVWDLAAKTLLSWRFEKFASFTELASAVLCMPRFKILVIEKPQLYHSQRRDVDPRDIIDLARTVGACHILAPEVIEFSPTAWKGQVPKPIHNARVLAKLSTSELAVLGQGAKNHNVVDATGIGLFYLGR